MIFLKKPIEEASPEAARRLTSQCWEVREALTQNSSSLPTTYYAGLAPASIFSSKSVNLEASPSHLTYWALSYEVSSTHSVSLHTHPRVWPSLWSGSCKYPTWTQPRTHSRSFPPYPQPASWTQQSPVVSFPVQSGLQLSSKLWISCQKAASGQFSGRACPHSWPIRWVHSPPRLGHPRNWPLRGGCWAIFLGSRSGHLSPWRWLHWWARWRFVSFEWRWGSSRAGLTFWRFGHQGRPCRVSWPLSWFCFFGQWWPRLWWIFRSFRSLLRIWECFWRLGRRSGVFRLRWILWFSWRGILRLWGVIHRLFFSGNLFLKDKWKGEVLAILRWLSWIYA